MKQHCVYYHVILGNRVVHNYAICISSMLDHDIISYPFRYLYAQYCVITS